METGSVAVVRERRLSLPWLLRGGFGRLFAGQAVSILGSQVTFLALPIAAVFLLGATPGAMGLLGALDNLPYLLFGLGVGVVVDRWPRRRLMISADLVRAIAVGTVPLAFALGRLSFGQLCAVVFVVGACNIVFDVAAQAQMPDLVSNERLVTANASLQTTASLSTVVGPGLAGQLIALVGAPTAILVDAGSYAVSALFIGRIREPEAPRTRSEASARAQIAAGLRQVRADRRLVALAGAASTMSLAVNAIFAGWVYYLATRLGWSPASIGLLYTLVGVSGAAGAVLMPALAGRIGVGRVLAAMPLVTGAGLMPLPLVVAAGASGSVVSAVLVGGSLTFGLGLVSFAVIAAGLRQTLAPPDARGRVLGTLRFFEWGSMPVGSAIGGVLGQAFGPAVTIEFGALAFMTGAGWVVMSPLRRMRSARIEPGS